jgi:hypothetical protein
MNEVIPRLLADLEPLPKRDHHVLKLSEITDADRAKHNREMWGRRRCERMDEESRLARELQAKRPVDYSLLPLRRRPIRLVKRRKVVHDEDDEEATVSNGAQADDLPEELPTDH